MNRSPELMTAMDEIVAILKKYDIGGHIILASQTHGEFDTHFPSWSKIYVETSPDGRQGLRFKSIVSDKIGDALDQEKEGVTSTVHLIQLIHGVSFTTYSQFDKILEMLESKYLITGGPKRL